MTVYMENETGISFPFDEKELAGRIMEAVLETEGCPYEATVNVLLTKDEEIREYNRQYRGIDRATDVLSFPNIECRRISPRWKRQKRIVSTLTAGNWCWGILSFRWTR